MGKHSPEAIVGRSRSSLSYTEYRFGGVCVCEGSVCGSDQVRKVYPDGWGMFVPIYKMIVTCKPIAKEACGSSLMMMINAQNKREKKKIK